jgi:peroxiredoxin
MNRGLRAVVGVAGLWLAAGGAGAQLPVGTPAPEFTLRDLAGKSVSLSQFRGKRYVLLEFWASESAPSMRSMPQLRSLQEKYGRQMTVLAIHAGEPAAQGAASARRLKLSFPTLLRGDQVMEQYAAPALPATFLIDPAGRIVEAQVGANAALWPRVEAVVSRFQPPQGDEPAEASSGPPKKGVQVAHELTFPMPPGPREPLVGQEVMIRFNRPEGIEADLVSVSVDGKQLAVFGVGSSYPWDATEYSNGPHRLRVAAQTASGRETWAVEQLVIVDNRPPPAEAGNGAGGRPAKAHKPKGAGKQR